MLLRPVALWFLAALALLVFGSAPAWAGQREVEVSVRTEVFQIASTRPSGIARNDRIWVTLYEPDGISLAPRPAVVLLHPLGEWRNTLMIDFGKFAARRGMVAAVVQLPFHMRRLPARDNPLRHYVSNDIEKVTQAFGQAISDASTVRQWLASRPNVDRRRIGVIGVSLGAIVAHTAMGKDEGFSAGVAILGGADFPDLYNRSILFRALHPGATRPLSALERSRLSEIDPLNYTHLNRPRRVLMIQAARDDIIPAANAEHLWRELGKPPIRWLDTNHYGPILIADMIRDRSIRYLERAWGSPDPLRADQLRAPTLKLSLLSGLDTPVSFGVALQTVSLLERPNHMSLLHFDVGLDMRGPYFGFAATVNAYLDVGYGRRFGRAPWRPYLSLHVAL